MSGRKQNTRRAERMRFGGPLSCLRPTIEHGTSAYDARLRPAYGGPPD